MKKLFLTLLTAAPALGYAQSYNESSGGPGAIIMLLIGIAFFLLIFLVLRQVVLWYWKIDTIIKNQQEQIRTQQATNTLLDELIKRIGNNDKSQE